MKNILLSCGVAILLSSCSLYYQNFSISASVGDFRQYTKDGFVITPATTGYSYDPVSTIELTFYPGYKEIEITNPTFTEKKKILTSNNGRTTNQQPRMGTQFFRPNYDYMLSELVKGAKVMGATGIMDLKIQSHYSYNVKTGVSSEPYKYTASGFAVLIK